MTTAGLVSADADRSSPTPCVKLVGAKVLEVTVGGLILATTLVVFAAALQVATVGLAAPAR